MNLENITEPLCDQLKIFFAEQMEEKRLKEERKKENATACAVIASFLLGINILLLSLVITQIWLNWKSRRAGPVTQIPKTPISNENLLECSKNKINGARIYNDSISCIANRCTKKLEKVLRMVFNLTEDTTVYLSETTRVISIKMDGFKNGAEFHSLEPADGVISGSYFTYQMFGDDAIQVTRYAIGKKSYVAGFCIYIKDSSVGDININIDVIKKLGEEAEYPGKEAVEEELKEEMEKAGRNSFPLKIILKLWKWIYRNAMKQNDLPTSYSSFSIA